MNKIAIKNISFFLLFSFLFFISCKKGTSPPVDTGKQYYPGFTGHWIQYRVDSAVWDGFYANDTANPNYFKTYCYFIKEKIDSIYLDNQNRPTIILGRYKQDTGSTSWHGIAAWAVNITPSTVEKVEENVRYVKLIFPIVENQKWNGNAFNTQNSQLYKYKYCFSPFTMDTQYFDSTVTVIERKDSFPYIGANNQYEVYAANIGLVFRRFRSVGRDATGKITNGVDYTYKYETSGN